MILRKINAILSLITTAMLMNHAIFNAVWMLSRGGIAHTANSMPWILFALMMIHAVISIVLAVLGHKGAEKRECNGYANLNTSTYIQRASGVSLILLTVLHIAGTAGFLQLPPIVHAILTPLFFAIVLMHTAISTGKAFITLGIGNAKLFKTIDVAIKLVCIAIWLADVIGFYLFLC